MTTLLTTRDIGAIVGAKGLAACLGTLVSYLEQDFGRCHVERRISARRTNGLPEGVPEPADGPDIG